MVLGLKILGLFKKQNKPTPILDKDVSRLVKEIKESKEKLSDKYSVWDMAKELEKLKGTELWEKPIFIRELPADLGQIHLQSPMKLHCNLTNMDFEIAAQHLIWIRSLFEALIKHIYMSKTKGATWNDLTNMKKFTKFLQKEVSISDKELIELRFSKDFRNCYAHDGAIPNPDLVKRVKKYYDIRDENNVVDSDGKLMPNVKFIRKWNDIIIRMTEDLVKKYNIQTI